MGMTGRAIKSDSAANLVAKHIEELILEGSLRPGESLLPERELAERLNVSRPTLRDGLKVLQQRGLLTTQEGRGVKVAQLGAATISDPLIAMLATKSEVADDCLEFRDIVESAAAAMAAQRANKVDMASLRSCLGRIDRAYARNNPLEETEADIELHMTIYEGSHNLVILQIMRALSGNLRTDVMYNRSRLFTLPNIRDLLRQQHLAIGEAIMARDPDAARSAAHDHLIYLRRAIREIRDAEAKLDISLRRAKGGGLTGRKTEK
jgi:GntR family transcriptional regulator, transcriptional repressor for pyruvate dehydrogenase complex